MFLAVLHAGACCFLAGLIWMVQIVVYPGFRLVGTTAAWSVAHRAHSAAMARIVVVPWAVQGGTLGLLLVRRTAAIPAALLVAASLCALATVGLTAFVAVPLHRQLAGGFNGDLAGRLVATNWWRTAAWTGAAGCSLAMVGYAAG